MKRNIFGLATRGAKQFSTSKRVLVTTPIFYVNGYPHIGHAYSGVLCDALVRWRRMKGEEVVFSTGTDEHGSKVEKAALSAGFDKDQVLKYCDGVANQFEDLFAKLNTDKHVFIRTTEERHVSAVNNMWKRLQGKGYIVEGVHSGWYCQSDEAFLTDLQVDKDRKISLESGHPVEWIEESNYKFLLSKFCEDVLAWIDSGALQPPERAKELRSFITHATIRDLSVSRPSDRVRWAIPVPNDPSQSIYVWLDALTNYLTVADAKIDPDAKKPASWNVDEVIHVVGKDIIRFHGLYWPAFLIGAGLSPPTKVIAHAHWTSEGMKMSKSLGNVICPFDLLREHDTDSVRYALLRNGGLVDDADFSIEMLKRRRTEDLANAFGNLLSRCLARSLTPQDTWPFEHANIDPTQSELAQEFLKDLPERVDQHFLNLEFAKGLDLILATVREANRVFTAEEPWVYRKRLKKNPDDKESLEKLETTIFWMLESLRICSILLQPAIPEASEKALTILGVPKEERTFQHASQFSKKPYKLQKDSVPSLILFPFDE